MSAVNVTFEMDSPTIKEVQDISRMVDECKLSLRMAANNGTVSFAVQGGLIRMARFARLMRKWSKS